MVKNDPDILLLDLDMPDINGFEVLSAVRAHHDYKYLPVIILTASEDPDSKLKALEMGATDFLSKPVDPSELALRVRNTLSAKAYQDQLAYYDNVTGLPNRKLFIDRLGRGIEWVKREHHPLVLLDIGLDRFRSINETLGLSTGDYVLQTIAARLKKVVRGSDSVGHGEKGQKLESLARIGGDEFSIILFSVNSIENATIVSKRVLQAINKPITVAGDDIYLRANIGISVYPEDGEDVESLIKHAGSAKDYAKQLGADNYQYYSSEMNAHSRSIMKMESDLRKALDNNEFELFYQPKVDIKSGRIMGMESLIRWFHPDDGMVSPDKFIPVAEELGLIVSIGDWVLQEACHRASSWIADGFSDLKVSVNVSAQQFRDAGFKASIISALKSSRLNPQNLVLEITESMLMGDVDHYVDLLNEIRQLGVFISLDDFGTGYSSLSYLKRFPISELKIDRSFLLEVPASSDDCAIVRAIIAMAHSLGQKVVAEGVEEIEQLNFLSKYGCDIIQGFYFSKPLNKSDFFNYLCSKSEQVTAAVR
jgi:diguanylate cyclase (GGDEF)-like protein